MDKGTFKIATFGAAARSVAHFDPVKSCDASRCLCREPARATNDPVIKRLLAKERDLESAFIQTSTVWVGPLPSEYNLNLSNDM